MEWCARLSFFRRLQGCKRVISCLYVSLTALDEDFNLENIVLKPNPVKWSGHGSDGLTRVNPKKKTYKREYNFKPTHFAIHS